MGRAKLAGADLREAQMGPLLLGADRVLPCDLSRASVKGADLRRALLIEADISRSDFTGAQIREADFEGVVAKGCKGLDIPSK